MSDYEKSDRRGALGRGPEKNSRHLILAECSMAGRSPGKSGILELNQCRRRQCVGDPVCLVPATNKLRNPYLSIGVIGVAFAIPAIQGRADPFHLINARDHLGLVQVADQLVALAIDIWCDFMSNLAGISAQCDALVERRRSKPNGTSFGPAC